MKLTLIVFLMLEIGMSARCSEVDSLIKLLPSLTHPNEKSEVLNKLCFEMVYSKPDSALQFGKQALAIGRLQNDPAIIGKAFNRIGIVYDVTNVWDTALMFYDSALFYATRARDTITRASAYNNIGLVYWNQSFYDRATESFFKSLYLFEALHKDKGVANTYNNIGLIFMEQGRNQEALSYQKKGLQIREKIKDTQGINDSKLNIALLYTEIGPHDSSLFFFRQIIPYYEKTENHYALGTAYTDLTIYYLEHKIWDSALFYSDKSIHEYELIQSNYRVATSLLNKASIYNQMGKAGKEIQTLIEAQKVLDDESPLRTKSKVLYQLAMAYERQHNYRKAAQLFMEYKTQSDSLYILERDEKIEEINIKYQTEKREKELLREKAANERLAREKAQAEIRVYNRNKWIVGISSLSTIIILLVVAWQERKKRKIQAISDALIIEEREKGLKAVFDAQENERKRIAKDLHDGIGQQLSAIKMYFQNLTRRLIDQEPELKKDISKIDKMITNTGTDVRNISHQMMPKTLTELGLLDAFQDLLDNCFQHTKTKYAFEHMGFSQRLPLTVEIALYRIAQELLQNIIKHSGATQVDVHLIKTKTHCVMIIEDNGKGITGDAQSDGIGMLNINSRLQTINGKLNMESETGEGTTATIRIALQ